MERVDLGAVRYIGSKARIVDEILDIVGAPEGDGGCFVDAFCGTGVVGARAADRGWAVRVNDSLRGAVAVSTARLLSARDVPFARFDGYEGAIAELNAAAPLRGFFWREYSPAGAAARMYFTPENAARIDAVRDRVRRWRRERAIAADEHELLLADLIVAAGRVANIAGTYGCFLRRWSTTALRDFTMRPRELREAPVVHDAFCGDVVDTPMAIDDVVYFDPPYTKRQYAAYYHVNETIACEDEPQLVGKTGLRPWQDKASEYCYKGRALTALKSLVESAPAARVLVSYSSEGHVALPDLEAALLPLGRLVTHELGPIGRYRPNPAASTAASAVTEYVVEVRKTPVAVAAAIPA
jgi:adenine-specific DNA-methyltransferase